MRFWTLELNAELDSAVSEAELELSIQLCELLSEN